MKNPQLPSYSMTKDFLKVRGRTRMLIITTFIQHTIEGSSQSNKTIHFQFQIAKEEVKLSLSPIT